MLILPSSLFICRDRLRHEWSCLSTTSDFFVIWNLLVRCAISLLLFSAFHLYKIDRLLAVFLWPARFQYSLWVLNFATPPCSYDVRDMSLSKFTNNHTFCFKFSVKLRFYSHRLFVAKYSQPHKPSRLYCYMKEVLTHTHLLKQL